MTTNRYTIGTMFTHGDTNTFLLLISITATLTLFAPCNNAQCIFYYRSKKPELLTATP